MKIKIRSEHASMLQMNDWLAESRDGESAERTDADDARPTGPGAGGPGYAVPASYGYGVPASYGYGVPASYGYGVPASSGQPEQASQVRAVAASPGPAVPTGSDCADPAVGSARPQAPPGPVAAASPVATAAPARTANPAFPARHAALTAPAGRADAGVRAVIGDQLRMPIMWCEMGSCVSWHADPAALGEADTRARAIAAGWRIDALGRLACPRCQQNDPRYRTARPVVPRDRHMAITRTARIPAGPGDGTVGRPAPPSSRDPRRAARGFPPPGRAELEWHHDSPADQAVPAGRYAPNPAGTSRSRGAVINAARAWRTRGGRQAATSPASEHGEHPMIAEPAQANPARATTLTGRRW